MLWFCEAIRGRIDEALRLREEIESLKLSPDVVTYNTLINGCFEHGSSEEGFKLIDEMEGRGMKLNSVTYNVMVKWFVKKGKMDEVDKTVGKMDEAFQLMDEMGRKGLKMDSVTLNTMLHALCRERKLDEAHDLLCSAHRRGYFVDEKVCLKKALKLFNTWISKGKDVDAVSYNTIILALCKEKRFGEAFDLLAEMEEKKLGPDYYTYNAILSGLTDAGRMKDAEEFISKIAEKGKSEYQFLELGKRQDARTGEISQEPHPDAIAYSNKINELCSQGRYKDAMKIFP
ncbi:hypothetical protein OIU84_019939 [Salix udensis]|uniref:Pentatricopeptide repeat-containing protein n=1 Tax=Salix udensis TaxID=889485 RepID=A0AAD6PJN6_9ROSI|nr:hypothetical protein OIU84_019939 [Salix udensis]